MENSLKNNEAVLVFCALGVSRSASIVIAYIMKKYNKNYEDAIDIVQKKRSIIEPNQGFIKQLINFENFLNKE
jgi:protein-tyrosine phosphatase